MIRCSPDRFSWVGRGQPLACAQQAGGVHYIRCSHSKGAVLPDYENGAEARRDASTWARTAGDGISLHLATSASQEISGPNGRGDFRASQAAADLSSAHVGPHITRGAGRFEKPCPQPQPPPQRPWNRLFAAFIAATLLMPVLAAAPRCPSAVASVFAVPIALPMPFGPVVHCDDGPNP